jgi:hypothetical protein
MNPIYHSLFPPYFSASFAAGFLVVFHNKNSRLPETSQGGHWVPLLLSFSSLEFTSFPTSAIFAL